MNFSDTNSEENQAPVFDIASDNGENNEEETINNFDTPTLHNGNDGLRVKPLELCQAWKSFKVSVLLSS